MCTRLWGMVLGFFALSSLCLGVQADKNWKKQSVEMRLPGGNRITAIYHPADKAPRMLRDKEPVGHQKKYLYPVDEAPSAATGGLMPVLTDVIDSPPIDGFVPYVAVTVTNANANDETDWVGYPAPAITGSYLKSTPPVPFTIGLLDTGASACLVGYNDASAMGIYSAGLVTDSVVPLSGATGSVDAFASYPLAVFVDTLDAVEPNGMMLLNTSGMKGEKNLSVVVGDVPAANAPDLPTAIGAPVAVYYDVVFDNEHKVSRTQGTTQYRGPNIKLYQHGNPAIPTASDSNIPLELRPTSSTQVSYVGTVDLSTFDFYPAVPSIITDGWTAQSLFFVSAVTIADGGNPAVRYTHFMLDTGAQVTVIGSTVGADMGLDTNHADFHVEITDVTGETTLKPGFNIDSLQISAIGQKFSATHVPVVLMDVQSPEGGYLEGIVGMNLFTSYNMVLEGGAFAYPPKLRLKLIANSADINSDGKVDDLDLASVCAAWLAQTGGANWNAAADIAPAGGDGTVNFKDFAVVAASWGWIRGQ